MFSGLMSALADRKVAVVTHPREPNEPSGVEPDASDVFPERQVSLPKELWRAIRRDPEHLPERLITLAHSRLAEPSRDWGERARAAHPDRSPAELAADLRPRVERFARINGALSGTPFLIALVPAYVSVLWQEARMVMCIAALNGRDPREPEFAGELLALRGLYETPQAAMDALAALERGDAKPSEEQVGRIRTWAQLVYRVMVLAGFLSAKSADEDKPSKVRAGVSIVASGIIYVITCVLPLTFMILMSWSCEKDVRTMGDRAAAYYGDEVLRRKGRWNLKSLSLRERDDSRMAAVRGVLVFLSLGIPFALIIFTVAHPVKDSAAYALSGLFGLAIVLAMGARAARA